MDLLAESTSGNERGKTGKLQFNFGFNTALTK